MYTQQAAGLSAVRITLRRLRSAQLRTRYTSYMVVCRILIAFSGNDGPKILPAVRSYHVTRAILCSNYPGSWRRSADSSYLRGRLSSHLGGKTTLSRMG